MKRGQDYTQIDVPFSRRDIWLIKGKIAYYQKRSMHCFMIGVGIGILYILAGRVVTLFETVRIIVIAAQALFFIGAIYCFWQVKKLTKDQQGNKKWMLLTALKEKRHFVGRHKVELVLKDKPAKLNTLFVPLTDEYLWEEGDLLSLAYLPESGMVLHYENLKSTVKI